LTWSKQLKSSQTALFAQKTVVTKHLHNLIQIDLDICGKLDNPMLLKVQPTILTLLLH